TPPCGKPPDRARARRRSGGRRGPRGGVRCGALARVVAGCPSGDACRVASRRPVSSRVSEIIVGIDLGTTNSLVAICDERGARVLAPEGAGPMLPSAVRYEEDAEGLRPVVGADARARAVDFPRATITSVKRLMGRSLVDAAADLPFLPYQVVEGSRQTARVAIPLASGGAVTLSPE